MANASGQRTRAANAERSGIWQLIVKPPNSAAATLSGWPSRAQAAFKRPCAGNGPAIASYSRRPATVARRAAAQSTLHWNVSAHHHPQRGK